MVITKKTTATLTKLELVEAIEAYLRSKNAVSSSVTVTLTVLESSLSTAQNSTAVLKAEWETN